MTRIHPPRSQAGPARTPQPGQTPRLSPSIFQPPRQSDGSDEGNGRPRIDPVKSFDVQEAAARQASAEAAEARRIQRAEHRTVVEYVSSWSSNIVETYTD